MKLHVASFKEAFRAPEQAVSKSAREVICEAKRTTMHKKRAESFFSISS